MDIQRFAALLGADFFTGVPDSQLKALCDFLMDRYGVDPAHHIIAANEGNAAALAAGYHLATGKTPVVYLQNSGLGNVINPLASLLSDKVYDIPCLFIIGWRGEPGIHDEPQHIFQGEATLPLLDTLKVPYFIIDSSVSEAQLLARLEEFRGRQAALVVRKGGLEYDKKPAYANPFPMSREEAIGRILTAAGDDLSSPPPARPAGRSLSCGRAAGRATTTTFSPWAPWATAPPLPWASPCKSSRGGSGAWTATVRR